MMTLTTLKSRIVFLQSDDLLKNIVNRLSSIVADCVFYNENVQFGSVLNRITLDVDYLENNYKTVDGMPLNLVINCLRNEVNKCIDEINHLQSWTSELSNPLFLA